VIEATGRLEFDFAFVCKKAKLPISIVNPAHIKKFSGAIGRLTKTDKLDAQLIAHYNEAIKSALSELRPETIQIMSDLLSRRNCSPTPRGSRLTLLN
jgi:transposase